MRLASVGYVLLGALVVTFGCTDDDTANGPYQCIAGGGVGCFQTPTAPLAAVDATGTPVAAPVLDCAAYEVTTAAMPLVFSGTTEEPGVHIETYAEAAFQTPLFDVVSDDTGAWSATVPAMPSLAFTRTSKDGSLTSYQLHTRIDVAQAQQAGNRYQTTTRAALDAEVMAAGGQVLPGRTFITATAYDCAGNRLVNAIGNIAPASGRNGSRLFESEVRTYYRMEDDSRFARRTELMQTTSTGGIALSNVKAGTHYVQLWGYLTEQDVIIGGPSLKLLAEEQIQIFEESSIVLPLHARHPL